MSNIIQNIFYDIYIYLLKKIDLYSAYVLKTDSVLKDDGWFRSFDEKSSIDISGRPIPWLTYPAIEFLRNRVNGEMSVLEYGAGQSTMWWASRVNDVIAIEHELDWYEKMVPLLPDNVKIYHIELEYGGAYSKKILEYENRFDIVVIDGRDRVNCAMNSIKALKDNGIIIWDNSDRAEYEEGFAFLYKNGFTKIEFVGLAPIVSIKGETGIFYRRHNCLGI